jgi:hypothetical protein
MEEYQLKWKKQGKRKVALVGDFFISLQNKMMFKILAQSIVTFPI